MDSIVVGIDGSASSAEALRWAVEEARLHDARVVALRCWGGRDHLSREGWDEERTEDEQRAIAELAALVEGAVPEDADLVEQRTMDARPEWGLLEVGADADLVVVGARGATGVKGLVVGSVSQQVVHHAHVPVAVVRHTRWPVAPRRVVVGVDGSPPSRRALAWAVEEARRRGAVLEAVHALERARAPAACRRRRRAGGPGAARGRRRGGRHERPRPTGRPGGGARLGRPRDRRRRRRRRARRRRVPGPRAASRSSCSARSASTSPTTRPAR